MALSGILEEATKKFVMVVVGIFCFLSVDSALEKVRQLLT